MTCQQLADFILDYLEGHLPAETKVAFEHHLTLCPNCVNYLASYETTTAMVRRAFDDDPGAPLQMPEELVQAILATSRGPRETP